MPSVSLREAKTAVRARTAIDSPLLEELLAGHPQIIREPSRADLVQHVLQRKEARLLPGGALGVWNPASSTGRIPQDTYIVDDDLTHAEVDWSGSAYRPMAPITFDQLIADALGVLEDAEPLYLLDRSVGADPAYALPVQVVTDHALPALFADTMFCPLPKNGAKSIFADEPFTLIVLPHTKVQAHKYKGVLRTVGEGTSDMLVAMDMRRRIGLVYGSSYLGCVKKLMFTVMNHLLPARGILSLHCAANEDADGNCALFLGLSGTGKTTLSTDPARLLIGDDEHGWSGAGIANFEHGCYAKLIRLNAEKEPEIFHAVFDSRPAKQNGCIIENALIYPDGTVDLKDDRLTENSRAAYPLSFLPRAKMKSVGAHPQTILFLTADASGVLPPVSILPPEQAALWFLLGYTSKIAGTEQGIAQPTPTFSRFFGGAFMTRKPMDYLSLFRKKIEEHGTSVYLVNTGWTGGAYGVGKRMDITLTRAIVNAALSGGLRGVECEEDTRFHLLVPRECGDIDPQLLQPKITWPDPAEYGKAADALAAKFREFVEKTYPEDALDEAIRKVCPGM